MISGVHTIIYTKDAAADRGFLRDVLGFSSIDSGDGWLIFTLPPAELAYHPHTDNNMHEIYFMCKDINAALESLGAKGVNYTPLREEPWGHLSMITLPGGGEIGLYEPRHLNAIQM